MGGRREDLLAFEMQLSWLRHPAVSWPRRMHELACLSAHESHSGGRAGFPAEECPSPTRRRLWRAELGPEGRSPRPTGLTPRWSVSAPMPVRPCHRRATARWNRASGPIRAGPDPYRRGKPRRAANGDRQADPAAGLVSVLPATGADVEPAWQRELVRVAPVPVLEQLSDQMGQRRVGDDCPVVFEHFSFSVPFRYVGRCVAVRSCSKPSRSWPCRPGSSYPSAPYLGPG